MESEIPWAVVYAANVPLMGLCIFCCIMATVLSSFFAVHVLQVMRNQVGERASALIHKYDTAKAIPVSVCRLPCSAQLHALWRVSQTSYEGWNYRPPPKKVTVNPDGTLTVRGSPVPVPVPTTVLPVPTLAWQPPCSMHLCTLSDLLGCSHQKAVCLCLSL